MTRTIPLIAVLLLAGCGEPPCVPDRQMERMPVDVWGEPTPELLRARAVQDGVDRMVREHGC